MLPKANRLKLERDFARCYKSRNRREGDAFALYFCVNSLQQSRFAVVVSKKNAPLATDRSLLKRRTREILRHQLGKIRTGYDIILHIKKVALQQRYAELEAALLKSLQQSRLL